MLTKKVALQKGTQGQAEGLTSGSEYRPNPNPNPNPNHALEKEFSFSADSKQPLALHNWELH